MSIEDLQARNGKIKPMVACHTSLRETCCTRGLGCIMHTYRFLMAGVLTSFLSIFLPRAPEASLASLARASLPSFIWLLMCLEESFSSFPLLQQLSYGMSPCPEVMLEQLGQVSPPLQGVATSSYLVSPWAERAEEEERVGGVIRSLADLVDEDTVSAQLVTFLVIFSSSGVVLAMEEAATLRQYRDQIKILLQNHTIKKHGSDRVRALDWMKRITQAVEGLELLGNVGLFGMFEDDLSDATVQDYDAFEVFPLD